LLRGCVPIREWLQPNRTSALVDNRGLSLKGRPLSGAEWTHRHGSLTNGSLTIVFKTTIRAPIGASC